MRSFPPLFWTGCRHRPAPGAVATAGGIIPAGWRALCGGLCLAFWAVSVPVQSQQAAPDEAPAAEAAPPARKQRAKGAKKPPSTESGAPSVAQLARQMRESLVTITQDGRTGIDGLGAGFVISSDGLIATNRHVIGDARPLHVVLADGRELEVESVHATDAHVDLALLKVKAEGLKAMRLGDSAKLEQGEKLVAMGNPEGLDFSVVEGVVSAVREMEIEGVPMIQVALPIERGNSGGPVLNAKGEVVGILTLKSLRTDNLGFAMPVNALKSLIEKPNPVPMEKWLTIGVLDKRQWESKMGARWSQRAGIIRAELPGDGFGGRSLCLSTEDVPELDFEVAVAVRLDDEAGAAGLAFCSDGGHRHYGFYPSGGKLRLTRFDGPDVYSWTILADVPVDSYRKGDWNLLRVRVEKDTVRGWVNGALAVEIEDAGLRGGRAGLCKFRDTVAEFRGFKTGPDLAPPSPSPELARKVGQTLAAYLRDDEGLQATAEQLLESGSDPAITRRLLVERRRRLEQQAASLRALEKDMHRLAVTRDLAAELAKPANESNLLRCALLLARHDNPELEVAAYMRAVERLASELRGDAEIRKGGLAAVLRLNRFLFEENGFHGCRNDFYNRSNSYVNEVIEDREGLPITLSVVYLEMARLVGMKGLFGVALPGKFMVGFRPEPDAEMQLVDVFEMGRVMSVEQAEADLNEFRTFDPELLEPAGNKAVILRMIKNLLSAAMEDDGSRERAMTYLNLSLALEPDSTSDRFARARLRQTEGDKPGAQADVRWLLEHAEGVPPDLRLQLEMWHESLGK